MYYLCIYNIVIFCFSKYPCFARFVVFHFVIFRELYYQLVNIASRQYMVDEAIDCISCILDVGPWEWGVLPTSKGLVYGSIQIFYSDEQVINCNVAGGKYHHK